MPLTQHSKLNTQNSLTDWHCHILPGMDDGPATDAESAAMARALAAAGFRQVCCTPHAIHGVYDNNPAGVKKATRQLQEHLTEEGIELSLLPGMEYYLDEFLLDSVSDPLLLPGNLLLVEIPGRSTPDVVKETLYQLSRMKITPLIAHPERCALLGSKQQNANKQGLWGSLVNSTLRTQNSKLLSYLQDIDCKFQGNLGSFAGIYGNKVKNMAIEFLQIGLYDCFGSDAHTPYQLEEMLKQGLSFK